MDWLHMCELFCFFCMDLLPERSPVHCTAHERNTVLKNGRHSGAESVEAGVDESSTISYSYKIKMMCKFYFHRCNTLSRNNENFKTTEVKFLFRSYHGRIGRIHQYNVVTMVMMGAVIMIHRVQFIEKAQTLGIKAHIFHMVMLLDASPMRHPTY